MKLTGVICARGGNTPQVVHLPSCQGAVNGEKFKILVFTHGNASQSFHSSKGRVVGQMQIDAAIQLAILNDRPTPTANRIVFILS